MIELTSTYLEQLHTILDARIADAHAAFASGDRGRGAAAIQGIQAMTRRMRVLTEEWRDLERNTPHNAVHGDGSAA
jgi:hypothetical protein